MAMSSSVWREMRKAGRRHAIEAGVFGGARLALKDAAHHFQFAFQRATGGGRRQQHEADRRNVARGLQRQQRAETQADQHDFLDAGHLDQFSRGFANVAEPGRDAMRRVAVALGISRAAPVEAEHGNVAGRKFLCQQAHGGA